MEDKKSIIYFEKDGDSINKYNVGYSRNELEQIVKDLINNCSLKEHKIEERCSAPKSNPKEYGVFVSHTRNTGKTKSFGECFSDETIYEYDYIVLYYPKLVSLIKSLLEGSVEALYDIMQYEIEIPINFDTCLEESKERIKKLIDENPIAAIKEIEGLKEQEEFIKLNHGRKSTKSYYEALRNSFKFNLIDTMPMSYIIDYNNFCKTENGNAEFYFPVAEDEKSLILRPIKHVL